MALLREEVDDLERQVRRAFALAHAGVGTVEEAERKRKDAREYLRARHSRRARQEAPSLTIEQGWRGYLESLSIQGRDRAEKVWRGQLAELVLGAAWWDITESKLRAWDARLAPRYAYNTVKCAFGLLSGCYRFNSQEPPWGDFRPRKREVREREAARDPGELEKIIRAALAFDLGVWKDGLFSDLTRRVLVLGLCGLRQGEAAALGWDEVDLVARTLRVRYQAIDRWKKRFPEKARPDFSPKTKGKKERPRYHVQHLHPNAWWALSEQKKELEKRGWYRPAGPVFPAYANQSLNVKKITLGRGDYRPNACVIYPKQWRKLVTASGVPNPADWVVHSLRHSCATLELLAGHSLLGAQQRTGHSSVRVFEKYTHAPRELVHSKIPELDVVKLARDLSRVGGEK